MTNLIVKCSNIKRGSQETFSSVNTGYQVKPLSAQGDYRPTKKHFVNWQVSKSAVHVKKGALGVAIKQLSCLKYGMPYLFLRTRMKFFVFGLLGKWKQNLYKMVKYIRQFRFFS